MPLVPRPSSLAPRAFTLVELMVVIGIIGLLVAIALPAFSSVMRQSKVAQTVAMLSTISQGLETYRGAEQLGGAYPPSYGLVPSTNILGWVTPHQAVGNNKVTAPERPLQGANLLAWALVGADLLGTPGFKNVNGAPDDPGRTVDFGGWADNTGTNLGSTGPRGSSEPSGLYAIKAGTRGEPYYTRFGPYVDLTRMTLPKPSGTGVNTDFTIEKLDTKPKLASIAFLDSFNQPILYYKANQGRMEPFACDPDPQTNPGVYNQFDNGYITGTDNLPGLDFGAGPMDTKPDRFHPMYKLGVRTTPRPDPSVPSANPERGTFWYTIWDQNATSTWKAHREDSYILLSAGPDGRFGTGDDIANIPVNP